MTEYITKEQALEAVKGKMWPGELEAAIKAIPAADVVEVVRCKDCKHQECCAGADDLDMSGPWLWCNHWSEEVEQDGFCNHGKPKH